MAIERMPITPAVLTWARKRLGYSQEALAAKRKAFKRVAEWESGESRPTYRQLEKLSKDLWIRIEVFFFPEVPDWPPLETSFRTMGSKQFAAVPPSIRKLMLKARGFQAALADLNEGTSPARQKLARLLSIDTDDSLSTVADQVRDLLGVSLRTQFDWRDHNIALNAWRSAFFHAGVTVMQASFDDKMFCGFSLYDDDFPIIYVNSKNTKPRQIFTLFHELAHLLYSTSGVDTRAEFQLIESESYSIIEARCNAVANAILVPPDELNMAKNIGDSTRAEAERLAKLFSVSREVIYRNFLDSGSIPQREYDLARSMWNDQMGDQSSSGFVDPNRRHFTYLGKEYVSLAFRRFEEDRIDEEELADYLAIAPKRLEKMEDLLLEARA